MNGTEGAEVLKQRVFRILFLFLLLVLTLAFAGAPLIQASLTADLDGDGAEEWILVAWKLGSYGHHRPSWVERDDAGLTQHVFIYQKKRDGRWHPIWMSSRTGLGISRIRKGEKIGGLDRESLVFTGRDGRESRWGWLSWGLVSLD